MALAESADPINSGLEFLWSQRSAFLSGLWGTVKLSGLAAVGATLLGLLLAAMRVSPIAALRSAGVTYISVVRNTPLTLVFLSSSVVFPVMGIQFGWLESSLNMNTFFTFAFIALAMYTACFIAEAIRSGINAISVGQAEAARAIGMTFTQSLRMIVLPQAIRSALPPLASVYIAMVKNSAIAAVFAVSELTQFFDAAVRDFPNYLYWSFAAVAAAYVVLVLAISGLFRFLEWWLAVTR